MVAPLRTGIAQADKQFVGLQVRVAMNWSEPQVCHKAADLGILFKWAIADGFGYIPVTQGPPSYKIADCILCIEIFT